MKLSSTDFSDNQKIGAKFTCDGENISPQLSWRDFPKQTKSFALSVTDPDAPAGTWVHWLVINIPASVNDVAQNSPLPSGAVEINNDFGFVNYGGPCPPSGQHHYVFTVYALDVEHLENVTKDNFEKKINEHIIDSAKMIGLYEREK